MYAPEYAPFFRIVPCFIRHLLEMKRPFSVWHSALFALPLQSHYPRWVCMYCLIVPVTVCMEQAILEIIAPSLHLPSKVALHPVQGLWGGMAGFWLIIKLSG
jgi:hypothetical protein